MAKVFDEDNVHHLWGLSPSVDLFDILDDLPSTNSQHGMLERLAQAGALHILQVHRALALYHSQQYKLRHQCVMKSTPEMVHTDWSRRLPQLCKSLGNCLQAADRLETSAAYLGL